MNIEGKRTQEGMKQQSPRSYFACASSELSRVTAGTQTSKELTLCFVIIVIRVRTRYHEGEADATSYAMREHRQRTI